MIKEYFTHFNGGRPYKVVVNGKKVEVFTKEPEYNKKVLSIEGVDSINVPKFSFRNKVFSGYSIFLSAKNTYIYICKSIVSFPKKNAGGKFLSYIDNNDVVNSVLIEKDFVYFLDDNIKMNRKFANLKNPIKNNQKTVFDLYDLYYRFRYTDNMIRTAKNSLKLINLTKDKKTINNKLKNLMEIKRVITESSTPILSKNDSKILHK